MDPNKLSLLNREFRGRQFLDLASLRLLSTHQRMERYADNRLMIHCLEEEQRAIIALTSAKEAPLPPIESPRTKHQPTRATYNDTKAAVLKVVTEYGVPMTSREVTELMQNDHHQTKVVNILNQLTDENMLRRHPTGGTGTQPKYKWEAVVKPDKSAANYNHA